MIRIPFEDRDQLLAEAPDTYYLTDHYQDHDAVLVRMSKLSDKELRDLLGMAHKYIIRSQRRRSSGSGRNVRRGRTR